MVRRGGDAVSQADFEAAVRDYTKSRTMQPTGLLDRLMLGGAS